MRWSSTVSERHSLVEAVEECVDKAAEELGGVVPDLAIAFASVHHSEQFEQVPRLVQQGVGDCTIIGCSGGGVIGAGSEVEHRPGFALAAASLPDVHISPFHISDAELPDGDAGPETWERLIGVEASDRPDFILMADPFSIRSEHLLMGLDYAFPKSSKIGGLASGASQPTGNALFLGEQVYREGAVGIAVHGDVTIETVVAQGCRPIGEPMHVARCDRNLLFELSSGPPLQVLNRLFRDLSDHDRQLARHSLFMGIAMNELNEESALGDFLIRNIVGIDPRTGTLAVGEMLEEGQTIQFHLRDSATSAQDLDEMLTSYAAAHPLYEEAGALLFQCLGRGSYLYGRPDHDTDMFRDKVGNLPLTGFFCNGEIGAVGGSTFLHGYTSSFGILRPRVEPSPSD